MAANFCVSASTGESWLGFPASPSVFGGVGIRCTDDEVLPNSVKADRPNTGITTKC